jgi:hypothetical protein
MTGHASRVVIATMTLVRDRGEEPLLRLAMQALASHGHPIVVTDGGSPGDFAAFLDSLPGVTRASAVGKGLVNQVRTSVGECAKLEPDFILYTEPDKLDFFAHDLPSFVDRAISERAGFVLASRSAESFATFPTFQRSTETTINGLCGEFLVRQGDYSYGPFVMDGDLAPHMESIDAHLGWGWRHYMFAVAHRLGRGLVHVVDDLRCPEDQRTEDDNERLHRLRQLGQNVNGLLAGLTAAL